MLAVFHQPGKPDWRLTYACKRSQLDDDTLEITSTQTAPRRYTFLLGENEPCRTAVGRLAELREKGEHLTLEEVEKAFSVERLNKDFFKDYKKHYETFTAHLLAPENAKAALRARFLQLEISADFVTDLRRDRDALDEINKRNAIEVQEGTEDTATITTQLAAISKEVDILDPIMGNKYETAPEKLHAWERASRVERDPKRGKKPGDNNEDTPPPAPPATPQ